jgi:hypothetical protein
VFLVRYYLGFDIPADGILHSHRSENLKSYMEVFRCFLQNMANSYSTRFRAHDQTCTSPQSTVHIADSGAALYFIARLHVYGVSSTESM